MIPYGDTIKIKRTPWVNIALIVINTAIFIYLFYITNNQEFYFQKFGFMPARFFYGWKFSLKFLPVMIENTITLFTAQFLHAGLFHLIGNMLFLFIFGDNLEDKLGHIRYLLFYLVCGAIALLVHGYLFRGSTLIVVGASGAIAGVLGGFYISYPSAKVKIFPKFFGGEVHSLYYLGIWFLFNLVRGILHLEGLYIESMAWWAHIGGFIAGALLIHIFALGAKK
ncbi:MAG: rhomboid family intramembrane serine protease [Candidatus Eremiobacteraeota bacterium]|nr:rhomboid family intramembrane serine protease [Candidatus Eremiobacteraeota bacterium]